jgi:hypothetical protein
MIPFLQTYWGPLLFFAIMFYLLAQGILSEKP